MDFNEDDIDFEQLLNQSSKKQKQESKPRLTTNIIQQSQKRKEYFKTMKEQHHQKVLKEEEKIYGKVNTFESQSFKKMKQLEREGKRFQYNQRDINDKQNEKETFHYTQQQYEEIQRKNYQRQRQYQQQYQQMMKERKEQQNAKMNQINDITKSKLTKEEIEEYRKRYLKRKEERLSQK